MLNFEFEQDPAEVLDYPMDFTAFLSGDSVISHTWTVPSPLAMVADVGNGPKFTVWIGTASAPVGSDYRVTLKFSTGQGRTVVQSFHLIVLRK